MMLGQNKRDVSPVLWTAAMNVPDTSGKGRGKVKKSEIITYPELEICSQYIDDQYWKDIFHQCAKKKFPRGFAYQEYHLKHRSSNNVILLPEDPAFRTQAAIRFFQEQGKMYSRRDQAIRRSQLEESIIRQMTSASLDWKKVAISKNRRAAHIKNYVERRYAQFPQYIRNELIAQIDSGFGSKYITKEHVHFDGGQILYIDGIDANETGIFFTRTPIVKKAVPILLYTEERDKPHQHYNNWLKFLEGYRKYLGSSSNKPLPNTPSFTSFSSGLTPEESFSLQRSEHSESSD